VPPRRNRPRPIIAVGEVLLWVLFAALLVPAGVVGWAIGHYTGTHTHTRTVTVGASATTAPTTTAAAPTTTAAAPATTAAAPATSGGGKKTASGAAAKAVFTSAGCGACHTFKPAGTSGTVGPDLDTAPEKDAKLAKMPLAAFVRESIVKPNAYIAPGYPKGVMPQTFAKTLSAKQIDELVAYIVGRK
jgi:mono/diheme cytochrome c family protein